MFKFATQAVFGFSRLRVVHCLSFLLRVVVVNVSGSDRIPNTLTRSIVTGSKDYSLCWCGRLYRLLSRLPNSFRR